MSGREFCAPGNTNHPKWNSWDIFKWRALSEIMGGGRAYLEAYKDGWIVYNKFRIKDAAEQHRIPPVLLACVAWAEVGGIPDGIKRPAFKDARCSELWREDLSNSANHPKRHQLAR
jgi:hypothetical protein